MRRRGRLNTRAGCLPKLTGVQRLPPVLAARQKLPPETAAEGKLLTEDFLTVTNVSLMHIFNVSLRSYCEMLMNLFLRLS